MPVSDPSKRLGETPPDAIRHAQHAGDGEAEDYEERPNPENQWSQYFVPARRARNDAAATDGQAKCPFRRNSIRAGVRSHLVILLAAPRCMCVTARVL
jgi:hypothetical protein